MNDQDKIKAAAIVDRIYDRTLKGNAVWEETSDNTAYQTKVGNYIIQVVKDYDQDAGEEFVKLLVRRFDGTLIDEIMPGYLYETLSTMRPELKSWQIFEDLHESARRSALGVDKAYDELLNLL